MKKDTKLPLALLVLAGLLVLAAAGIAGLLFARYSWVGGGFRVKGDAPLDLRGEAVSLAD